MIIATTGFCALLLWDCLFSFYVFFFYFLVLENIIGHHLGTFGPVCASCCLNDTEYFLVLSWQEVLSLPIYNSE